MTLRQLADLLNAQVEKYPDADVLIHGTDPQSGESTLDELDTVSFVFTSAALSVRFSSVNE